MLAIASNIVGLTVISLHSPIASARPAAGVLVVAATGASAWLHRAHVAAVWPHVWISGPRAWLGWYRGGLHRHETADHFEHVFEYPVQVVAFLFALVKAGVLLSLSAAYLLRVGRFASLEAPPQRLQTALTRGRS
jgi:hypothetical protein